MTNAPIFEDSFDLLCGKLLGTGIHREVYECRLRPDCVVKVEIYSDWRTFANVNEWSFWEATKDTPAVARWLAPIEFYSPDMRLLIQKRADPLPPSQKLPDMLPRFLTDLKRENFGTIDGNIVCVDYATCVTVAPTQMKKASWKE